MKRSEMDQYFTEPQVQDQLNQSIPSCTTCCWSKILASKSDFKAERPLLQSIIEDAGHACLFLPKFHCELNPIELLWAYIKQGKFLFALLFSLIKLISGFCMHQTGADYQRQSHTCTTWKQFQALFERAHCSCPLTPIEKPFQNIDYQHSAYKLGLRVPEAQRSIKKYSSHCCIPRGALIDIHDMSR